MRRQRSWLEKYVRVFKQAGLQLVSLEPDNAALIDPVAMIHQPQ